MANVVAIALYSILGVVKAVAMIGVAVVLSIANIGWQIVLGIWKVIWTLISALRIPDMLHFFGRGLLFIRDLAYKYGLIIWSLFCKLISETYKVV